MAVATHGQSMNDKGFATFTAEPSQVEEYLLRYLSGLDGKERFAFIFWKFNRPGFVSGNSEAYIQAGGASDQMTLEIRRAEGSKFNQYVIGKKPPSASQIVTRVRRAQYFSEVLESEIFTAEDAVPVFKTYYDTNNVNETTYSLRFLDLSY